VERRYQVFVSSTYTDLQDERHEIIQALLELDCIPSGMELFPATNESAWELIKGIIDDTDYYCLVVGGRYGSVDSTGVGYTEKEYDYAMSIGKPMMAFLHREPGQITIAKSETTDDGKVRLQHFRKKVEEAHHCKYWTSAEELGGQVSRSLINLKKMHPSDGWIPGKYAADEGLLIEVANLRARNAELMVEIANQKADQEQQIAEGLSHGTEIYTAFVSCINGSETERRRVDAPVSWDSILKYVGPALLTECSEDEFYEKLKLCFFHTLQSSLPDIQYQSIVIPHIVVDQIKVQLRALGQMVPGLKRRAVADKKNYWKLTSLGETRLLSIQAITSKAALTTGLSSSQTKADQTEADSKLHENG
jgi:hypothetical protein